VRYWGPEIIATKKAMNFDLPIFLKVNHGKSIIEFPYRKMLRSSCQLSCPFCRAWFIFGAPRMEFYQEALEMFEKGLEKEPGLRYAQIISTSVNHCDF
jgi:hypothetical protein